MPEPEAHAASSVRLWHAALDPPAHRVTALAALLSREERARAERFRFDRDRRRFIVAHGLLRVILGRALGRSPTSLRFEEGPYGKPALAAEAGSCRAPFFNLAHSGDLALVGFSADCEIGVDVEHRSERIDPLQLAARFFSPAETRALRSLAPEHRLDAFYNAWTRKEAYVKALGLGLSRPLDSFDVTLRPGESARLLRADGDNPARWSLHDVRPRPGFAGAVAVRNVGCHVTLAPFAPDRT